MVFSALDANLGAERKVDECDCGRMACTSHHALYWLTRRAYELNNVPAILQKVIDVIPASVRWQLALLYSDEIFVLSKVHQECFEHLRHVLRVLYEARAILKLNK